MNLRKQKSGKQIPWTIEEIGAGLQHFNETHGHYPTAPEIDKYEYLPSARSIERSFGGVVAVRTKLGLGGQTDFRSGKHSADRSVMIAKRARKTEQAVHTYLCERFGSQFVHREYFFSDDKRSRADFFIFDKENGFCVDVFYPSNRRNLIGCLNSKLDKYLERSMREYPVIFLQMNEDIGQEVLDQVILKKSKKLLKGQYLMCWDTFAVFCSKRDALKTLRQ